MTKIQKSLRISNFITNFAAGFREYMRNAYVHMICRLCVICWMVCAGCVTAMAQIPSGIDFTGGFRVPAGTTPSTATLIDDTTMLRVQSGMNYLRFTSNHLPATVVYVPDTAFGPVPTAIAGDTLQGQIIFYDCIMGWLWQLGASEEEVRLAISAHTDATVYALPTVITHYDRIVEVACDSFTLDDHTWTESGEYYLDTTVTEEGDRLIRILDLTIKDCSEYDTVYFCPGFNTQHVENLPGNMVRSFMPYRYEDPSEWDYMEGVIVSREKDRTMVDINRAETNLYNHYTDGLSPIEAIIWSVRYIDAANYVPLVIETVPQWIENGQLALQVQFRCGEIYNNEFPMAIDELEAGQRPVKCIEKGQVIIVRGGERYNVLGTKVE